MKEPTCTCGDQRKHHGHCGCCGNPIAENDIWCAKCSKPGHLLKRGYLYERTWFAQFGTDCPFTLPEYRIHDTAKDTKLMGDQNAEAHGKG